MLYRYARNRYVHGHIQFPLVSAEFCLSEQFADYDSVSDWAKDAMGWGVYHGLIHGTRPTTLSPQGNTTRAQTAAILERFATAFAD